MKEIREIYKCADECSTTQHDEDVNSFVSDLENFKLEETVSASHAEENIVFYIAGYIARSICKKSSCKNCNEIVSFGKMELRFDAEEILDDSNSMNVKEEFTKIINRGGLTKSSNFLYVMAVNASTMLKFVNANDYLRKSLME